jgi:transcriptional regulator with XRE-family HTH domain
MKKNLKSSLQEIEKIFSEEPSINQKAWGIINDFYHLILSRMENEGISKSDLAKRLGRTRSAISQMFNKNPNLTIKKMVEIADAIGLDLSIIPTELKKELGKVQEKYVFVYGDSASYREEQFPQNNATIFQYGIHQGIIKKCSTLSKFKPKELH